MREMRVADATSSDPVTLLGYPEVIDDLREVFLSAPSAELVKRHVADMLVLFEATRLLSRDARRKRRRLVVGSSLGIGAALVAGAGVAAASGHLPDPLQHVVATAVEPFGVDLPAGRSDDAPGRGGENPGQSDAAPGQQGGPGNSESAPGRGGENPGRSSTAPGHSGAENNRPADAPGNNAGGPNDEPPGLVDGVGRPAEPGAPGQDNSDAKGANGNANASGSSGQSDSAPGRNK